MINGYMVENNNFRVVIMFTKTMEKETLDKLIRELKEEKGDDFSKEQLKNKLDTLNVNYTISSLN